MLTMDLKARLKNPTWWVSVIGGVGLIASYYGVDITKYIGEDWKGLIGTIFGLLTVLGITADTSTLGISDQVATSSDSATQNVSNVTASEGTNIEDLANSLADLSKTSNSVEPTATTTTKPY